MSQASLSGLLNECRAAYNAPPDELVIHESLEHAFRLKMKAGEIEQEIKDRHAALDAELEGLYEEIKRLNAAKDRIVQEHVDTGTMEEAGYKVEPIVQKQNRKPDMDKIRRHEDDWNLLISLEVKRIKENYVPNQTALKVVFGKQFEAFLIPAEKIIIGYEVAPVAVMPEKAGEVEA
jgi:hypothetical protein